MRFGARGVALVTVLALRPDEEEREWEAMPALTKGVRSCERKRSVGALFVVMGHELGSGRARE